jgi:hypothetical protein
MEVPRLNYHMRRKEVPVKECMVPSLDVPTCLVVKIIPYTVEIHCDHPMQAPLPIYMSILSCWLLYNNFTVNIE